MSRNHFLRIYHYSIESLLVYLITFIYYMHEGIISPILPFLAVVGGGAFVMVGLFYLTKNRSFGIIILSGILITGIGYLVDYRLELLVLLVLFVSWRVPAHLNEADMKHEILVLGYTFISGIIIFLFSSFVDYPYSYVLVLLTSFQVIVIMIGRFIDSLLSSGTTYNDTAKKQIKWVLNVITGLVVGVTVITIALPILKPTFFFLLKSVFFFFGVFLMPLLYFLLGQEELLSKFFDAQYGDGKVQEAAPAFEDVINMEEAYYSPLFGWTLFVIVMIVILLLYWKKYRIRQIGIQADKELTVSSSILTDTRNSPFAKGKPPKDHVRRLFYELERYAAKHRVGRMKEETAKEWLERIGYNEDNEVVSYYETVRYQETPLSKEQKNIYEKIVRDIKKCIKENKH
ncbi:hypothetical protein ACLM5H_17605 [Fredinandcohnia humi]